MEVEGLMQANYAALKIEESCPKREDMNVTKTTNDSLDTLITVRNNIPDAENLLIKRYPLYSYNHQEALWSTGRRLMMPKSR